MPREPIREALGKAGTSLMTAAMLLRDLGMSNWTEYAVRARAALDVSGWPAELLGHIVPHQCVGYGFSGSAEPYDLCRFCCARVPWPVAPPLEGK